MPTPFNLGKPIAPETVVTPGLNTIVQVGCEALAVQYIELELTSARMEVGNVTASYGNITLCTLPDSNFLVLGSEVNLSIVKGNTTNGIVAATDIDLAIGTAPASNVTLATTMLNVMPKQDIDDNLVTVTIGNHSLAATPALAGALDSSTNALYLNASVGNIATADYMLVTGTVSVAVINLKNKTS